MTTPNLPVDAIEAAAKSAYEDAFLRHAPSDAPRWDGIPDAQESWRAVARKAVAAALPKLGEIKTEYAVRVDNNGDPLTVRCSSRADAEHELGTFRATENARIVTRPVIYGPWT